MRKQLLRFMSLVSVALAVCFFAPQRAAADDDDPPSRVARLAYANGNISFNPAGTDDWVAAVVNRPMTTGDKLWSDDNSRAELHLGYAVIRLSDHTGFSFLNLTDNVTQLRLTEGTLNIRVRRLGDDETFEVDTPNLALSVLRPGSYRISVNEAGDATMVAVRGGQGEITGGGSAYTIHAREEGAFSGTDQLDADIRGGQGDEDDFDQWCSDRDRRAEHSASARYVSDDVVGYEDLDQYGGWRPVPEYGNVWFPQTVVVGWAPYRYGHWVWIAPWGWTWVDDAPWGFAPFHYGRWVVVDGEWGWVPSPPRPVVVGAVYVRPVYAPALVAWVGGPHFGVGVAVGSAPAAGVAWFPLGPRDVYCPSYHVSQTYVTNVNVSNTVIVNRTQVTNVYNNVYVNKTTVNVTNVTYQNQSVNGAVTATSNQAFTSAQPVHNNMIRVNQKEIASAPVAPMTPAVAPQQRSVVGAGAQARFTPPPAVANRAVVAKAAPPPAPVSFAKQQQIVQANGGRPPAISQIRQAQPEVSAGARVNASANANVKMAPPVRQGPAQNAPANRANADAQQGNSNRPAQGNMNPANPPTYNPAPNANAGSSNRPANASSNQGTPNNANQGNSNQQVNPNRSSNVPANQGNGSANQGSSRAFNDRPPSSRPANGGNSNPQVEQKPQQQPQNSHANQDQERPKAEPKQVQEKQNNSSAQNNANAKNNSNAQNNGSAQNANAQKQENAGQKQPQVQQTRQRQDTPAKPPKQDKPAKQDKPSKQEKKDDKPHR